MSSNAAFTRDASANRGVPGTSNPTVSSNPKSQEPSKRMSFSSAVKSSAFPKKEQAIIFPVVEGLQVRDYVVATGNVVDPKDILFASRMSNNRICLYFSSKTIVDNFIENHGGVNINDIYVAARKLILPAKRVVLSNVSPCIPHAIIEDELKAHGLKLVSPMSFIGAGIGVDKFRHVYSFRRQVFIAIDPTRDIPSSICVTFEEEEYRIFLSDDKLRCFRCQGENHIASNCSAPIADIDLTNASKKRPLTTTEESTEGASLEVQENYSDSVEAESIQDSHQPDPSTRTSDVSPTPPTDNTSPSTENDTPPQQPVKTKSAKKMKLDTAAPKSRPDIAQEQPESYEELETLWQEDDDRPMGYIDFTQFLRRVKNNNRPLDVARLYTDNIEGLLDLLRTAHLSLSDRDNRALKQRCRRLTVSLKKALKAEGIEIGSPFTSRCSSASSITRAVSQESLNSETSY